MRKYACLGIDLIPGVMADKPVIILNNIALFGSQIGSTSPEVVIVYPRVCNRNAVMPRMIIGSKICQHISGKISHRMKIWLRGVTCRNMISIGDIGKDFAACNGGY